MIFHKERKMTMEEKLIEKEGDQPVVKKKVYTPPTLTVYGKLTELTAAGTGSAVEDSDEKPGMPHANPLKRP
jgi:hypothetical protein